MKKTRCAWVSDDADYIAYHDDEWGLPLFDDRTLFEMLILEGAQAGLSWITILKRREGYRKAYDQFDPPKMATWSDDKLLELREDTGIIRNRLKIEAARTNARAYLAVVEEQGSFSDYLWSFVDGTPIQNAWPTTKDVPVTTAESDAMSKDLKKRGFKFVGSTICYALMQAVGMVNDHTTDCFRYREVVK